MKKSNKEINGSKGIEAYFTTEDECWNEYTFDIYSDAVENHLFSDVETPLRIFHNLNKEFPQSKNKTLQIMNKVYDIFTEEELNKDQQDFILRYLTQYFYVDLASYEWNKTLKHLEAVPELKDKIIYLIEIKSECRQAKNSEYDWKNPGYSRKCSKEIKKLKQILKIQKLTSTQKEGRPWEISKDWIDLEKILKEGNSDLSNVLPHQTDTNTKEENRIFKNNFDKINSIEIYMHFKAGLVEKEYLTEQELNEYLRKAFELKTIPETRFKIKNAPKKAAIEAVFYTYYKNVAGKIHGKQKYYAALLGDYFEGYKTSTVSSNFSKSVY